MPTTFRTVPGVRASLERLRIEQRGAAKTRLRAFVECKAGKVAKAGKA